MMDDLEQIKADALTKEAQPGVLQIDFTTMIMWILGVLLLLLSFLQA